ncbi:FimV/HubP family polar landmark protein [Uliginosibacterium sp. H3]|uniref:FimV/HubP family polar landmark protein n=1 Tax=Uliginosibacterium silvisoli TaxID=3114758 RepID=A0ABU6KAC0_9RHOO|nr:FimV/HubP family polar landmark protein [Uliginosibacterium sp. H3]
MIASISGGAGAAGLGRINVLSSLGQPLRAEVEIAATPDELEAMSAKVATPEAHARANIEYAGELTTVRMSIERRGGAAVVKIFSDRAFNEPFVDMLVELNWGGGRILREYTFLLDPAETAAVKPLPQISEPSVRSDRAPAAQTSAASRAPRKADAAPSPRSTRPAAKVAPAERAAEAPAASEKSGEYTVRQGDSASSIAARVKPVEVTRDQMMAALYQANQSEFGGGNINRLRVGQVLKVPSAADAAAIDKAEARQIIVKASSFEGLKQEVGAAVAKAPAKDASSTQAGSGKVAPKVEEKASAAQAKDELKISKAPGDKGSGAADGGKSAARVQALEEDVAARDKALKEAKSRTAELERNVKELEKLVQLKSQNLADLQKQAEAQAKANAQADAKMTKAEKAAAEKAEKAAAAEKAKAEKLAAAEQAKAEKAAAAEKAKADKLAAAEKLAAEKAATAEKAAAEKAAAEKAAQDKLAAEAAEKAAAEQAAKDKAAADAAALAAATAPSAPVVELASAPAPVVEASAPVQASAPAVVATPPVPPVAEEESGLFTNPLTLGALGLAVLGAGYVVVRNRRRSNANSGMTSMSEVSTSPNSVFGNAGGQTVDTGTSVLHTDFSQSGLSAIDTDEGVDPVAEADVYMAYGRDAQAEEILLDALKNDPSRIAIYLKLLEIYAQRRSVKQFENIATDLFTQTGGAGDDWAKAAALGARLDPGNPLYGSGNTTVIIPPEGAPSPAPVAAAAIAEAVVAAAPALAPEPVAAIEPTGVSFGTNNVSQMRATWTVPGEIGQFTGSGDTDAPMLPAEAEVVASAPEPLNLDFNLDLELPEGDEPETQVEAREEEDDLPPLALDSVAAAPVDVSAPLEFDLDMDPFAEQPVSAPAASQQLAAEAAVDEAMQALSETDADMGIERAMERTSLSVVDLEKTNFESSLLDFDFELGEDTNVSRSNMDLSDISLRTDAGLGQPQAPAPVPAPSRQQAEFVDTAAASQPAVGTIDVHDEVSTKLELARAYEEMGDIEGARELLEEVMADGADQQKQMAQTILSRIA